MVEQWCDVEDEILYNVAMPSFLATNMDRKAFRFEKVHQVGIPDYECLEKYIIEHNPINTQIDGRLIIEYPNKA